MTLNAKQRRQLLRKHQHQQEATSRLVPEFSADQKRDQNSSAELDIASQVDTSFAHPNTQAQRRLAQLTKQKSELSTTRDDAITSYEANIAHDNVKLNAQARRLRKRESKRKADGTNNTESHLKKQKASEEAVGDDNKSASYHKSIHLTLFVGQLPFKTTEAMIRKHFAEAGEITLRMLTDKKTKKFKGMAFIEVKDNKALGAALSRHHTLLLGRRINVELTAGGGGKKSEIRRQKIDSLRSKQSIVQVKKAKALIQKRIDSPEYKLTQEDVDDRMIDFLSWFDYETAKKALDELDRCVSDNVNNRKAFFMGILKRFRQTDGLE